LHFSDIDTYVSNYSNFRYGIDILPTYIDSSTYDYNDTVYANTKLKRRCALMNGSYVIVSGNGYASNTNNQLYNYAALISCVIAMTDTYESMALTNPCLNNANSAACQQMLSLL